MRISVELYLLKCVYGQKRNCVFTYCVDYSKYVFTFSSEYKAEFHLLWPLLVIHEWPW